MSKILFFDVETTGTDSRTNDIVQLSGAIEIDGDIKETFNLRMRPFNINAIEEEALRVTGLKKEDILGYPDPKQMLTKFKTMLGKYVNKYDKSDKFIPAGYNVKFDIDFIQAWFHKCGDVYGFGTWQNWKAMDPLPVLQFMDTQGLISLPNYKLSTVCEHFGIEINAHDALSDITATKEVINKVRSLLR